jgi:hypothetical protein
MDKKQQTGHHIVDANKMITAVDWLVNQIFAKHGLFIYDKVIQEAKAIEKEHIIIAHGTKSNGRLKNDGQFIITEVTGEQYYNEIYNK